MLGKFQESCLLATASLGDKATVMRVVARIRTREGRTVNRGAVDRTLRRLVRQGLVVSRSDTGSPLPGGRAAPLYEVTGEGLAALAAAREEAERRWIQHGSRSGQAKGRAAKPPER